MALRTSSINQKLSTDSEGSKFSSCAFYYMHFPLKTASYFLASPLVYTVEKENGKLHLHQSSSFWRKIIFGFLNGIVLVMSMQRILRVLWGVRVKENPIKLFDIAQEVLALAGFSIWFSTCWKVQHGFKSLMDNCYKFLPKNSDISHISKLDRVALVGFCLLNTIVLRVIHTLKEVEFDSNYSEKLWIHLKRSGGRLRYSFHLDDVETPVHDESMSPTLIALSIGFILAEYYMLLVEDCAYITPCIACFVCKKISEEYMHYLKTNPKLSLKQIRQSYGDVVTLVGCFNDTLSYVNLLMYLSAIPYFGKYTIEAIDSVNWAVKIEILFYISVYCISFERAARANYNFGNLVKYMYTNQKRLKKYKKQKSEFGIFMVELIHSVKTLGHNCGHYFTLTYASLGSFFGILATFLIIVVQFQFTQPCV